MRNEKSIGAKIIKSAIVGLVAYGIYFALALAFSAIFGAMLLPFA
ncbi:hypothetical protein [Dysgonomonas sp. 216]|nr:hypothetical protein [Dysgonomonas sp. 216]